MNRGSWRHFITIEEPVNTQNATTGVNTVTWSQVRQCFAEVLTGPGKEYLQAGSVQSDTDARINIDWFSGLSQKMRILWDGKVYNIKTFTTDRTARRYYFIEATEGVNDGE